MTAKTESGLTVWAHYDQKRGIGVIATNFKGTTFTIYLPLDEAQKLADEILAKIALVPRVGIPADLGVEVLS